VALLVAPICLLGGCASEVTPSRLSPGTHRYFGYVVIRNPSSASELDQVAFSSVACFGASMDRGLFLGYSRETYERLPLDSRVVFNVSSDEQLDKLMKALPTNLLKSICLIDSKPL